LKTLIVKDDIPIGLHNKRVKLIIRLQALPGI
jgi:hypothetical protein